MNKRLCKKYSIVSKVLYHCKITKCIFDCFYLFWCRMFPRLFQFFYRIRSIIHRQSQISLYLCDICGMYLEAVFRFYVLLNHFIGHFFFGLVRFGSFSNTIYRNLALALSKLHINVDITVGFFVGQKNYRLIPAPSVMDALRQAKEKQNRQRLLAGSSWDNVYDMVFTRDNGMFIRFKTLYVHFKALVSRLNRPEVRFHDIRHTYATLAIQSEVDFKTLSLSLGHATVAFTLDTYGHVSNHMSQNAAAKMEKFICSL